MANNRAKRHVHKYHKVEMYSSKVWACALPDCNHYMPQHMERMVEGKYSICWTCGDSMTLHQLNMKMDKPQCFDCVNGSVINKENVKVNPIDLEDYLTNRLGELKDGVK